ncbi:MAG: DUF2851 family protein [Bacteroidetes bacterium]|nr:DUF2851 family protein [Bacteroidota bacterium]
MTEELVFFLWKHRLYTPESLILPDGTAIEVIHPGNHNHDAGPDFSIQELELEILSGPEMPRSM